MAAWGLSCALALRTFAGPHTTGFIYINFSASKVDTALAEAALYNPFATFILRHCVEHELANVK